MESNELYHYGVKGMRWGIRKEQYKSLRPTQQKKVRQVYRKGSKIVSKSKTSKAGKAIRYQQNAAFIGQLLLGLPGALAGGEIGARRAAEIYDITAKEIQEEIVRAGRQYYEDLLKY